MNRNLIRVGFFMVLGSLLLTMGFSSKIVAQPDGGPVYEGPFNGDWQTVKSNGRKLMMGLQQSRTTVTGRYESIDGAVRGTILGTVATNVLRFTWVETNGSHGAGRLTLSSDGRSFQGTFSTTDNPDDDSGGTWNGTTTRLNKPGPEGERGTGGKMSEADLAKAQAEYEARQKNAPAIFQGVWRTKSGDKVQFPELLLQQADNRVVGQLYGNQPNLGLIRDGIVDHNTLRFTVWRPNPPAFGIKLPDQQIGIGELVMDADGKSFRGTILSGAVTSSTLIAR